MGTTGIPLQSSTTGREVMRHGHAGSSESPNHYIVSFAAKSWPKYPRKRAYLGSSSRPDDRIAKLRIAGPKAASPGKQHFPLERLDDQQRDLQLSSEATSTEKCKIHKEHRGALHAVRKRTEEKFWGGRAGSERGGVTARLGCP